MYITPLIDPILYSHSLNISWYHSSSFHMAISMNIIPEMQMAPGMSVGLLDEELLPNLTHRQQPSLHFHQS